MDTKNNYALHGKIMLSSVILLCLAVLLILILRICTRGGLFRRRQSWDHHHGHPVDSAGGLDLAVLKSIPTFIYTGGGQQKLDCAVCLSEFENDDLARVLPKCGHAFHVECIDMWFDSHSNCPLCRAPVEIQIPSIPPQLTEGMVKSETAPPDLEGKEVISGLLRPEYCRCKKLDLVGIVVEMPPGGEKLGICGINPGPGRVVLTEKEMGPCCAGPSDPVLEHIVKVNL